MAEEEATEMDVDGTTTHGNVALSQGLKEIFQAGESFAKCEINVSTLFTTNTHGQKILNAGEDGFLELSCLDKLRGSGDNFLMPARVFVRSEMQAMFCNLLTKATPQENKRVLTGSAGIGKSVLLFLVALRFQLLPENSTKKISFIRKVKESHNIALYIMEPGEQPSTIRLVFSDTMDKADYQSNFELWKTVRGYTKVLKTSDYRAFVDGPLHTEIMDLLNTSYRFFCTSGGFPTVSQAEITTTIVSILTGWKEETICSVLTRIGRTPAQAREIYSYSGGRIRLALMGTHVDGKLQIRKWFDDLLSGFGQEKVQLAITKTDSHASMNSSDRLRTRFVDYDGSGTSLLIVDSQYAMSRLRARLDVGDFVSSYNLATVCGLQSARGWFFEEIMHLWFKRKDTPLIEDWIRSVGDAAEGIKVLDREKRYWIPATSNFANIDAAFAYQNVLVCIQYTVRQQHGFDKVTFWQDFAGRVHKVVPFSSVAVWFVSPNGTGFQNTHEGYNQTYAAATGTALRSRGSLPLVPVSFDTAEVTCVSTEMVDMTAPKMAFLNEESYRNEQALA
mmetsp:Transcript_8058/g.20217  ORF Transcript_8058/g.20217 Transcript_8058/m.20217 type:complete len:561 (+) Transcript_8058:28-1710(+)